MSVEIDRHRSEQLEKMRKDYHKGMKKFIKGYIKILFKRDSKNELEILQDVCYQLYTYCEIKDKRCLNLKEKVENE
jgi:hypothetical protein